MFLVFYSTNLPNPIIEKSDSKVLKALSSSSYCLKPKDSFSFFNNFALITINKTTGRLFFKNITARTVKYI